MRPDAWKTIFTGATVLVSLVLAAWSIRKDIHARKGLLRDDFRFALELHNAKRETAFTPMLSERGYWALIGRTDIPYREIEHLASFSEPALALKFYPAARKRLHFDAARKELALQFKGWSRHKIWRKFVSIASWLGYIVFYVAATSPLLFHAAKELTGSQMFSLVALTIPTFLPLSILSLRSGVSVTRAERLIELQERTRVLHLEDAATDESVDPAGSCLPIRLDVAAPVESVRGSIQSVLGVAAVAALTLLYLRPRR